MVIIHGRGEFTADEVRAYRQQIYQVTSYFIVEKLHFGNDNSRQFFIELQEINAFKQIAHEYH